MYHSIKTKKKNTETGDSWDIYKTKLDRACFQHVMTYRHFKDFPRKIAADKVLRDKASNIAKNPKYDEHQTGLATMVCKFFDKIKRI